MKILVIIYLIVVYPAFGYAQSFYFGNDLSYANMMEDCGATFKESGQQKDVYKIYADNGHNLVRLRLWVDPIWQNDIPQPEGVKKQYHDFEDIKKAIKRVKETGMLVLLDFHYSDFWADPGRQVIPERWKNIAHNTNELADSLYGYTFNVLSMLDAEGLMPEQVQVGNETNMGMMVAKTLGSSFEASDFINGGWDRQAVLFNAGIKAVRDASENSEIKTKIVLHYAGVGSDLRNWFANITAIGVNDFDIIGFSYYKTYHGSSIQGVGKDIEYLRESYPEKEIVIVETGYPWTTENFDTNGNIITGIDSAYVPLSPEMQRKYLIDLSKEVIASGGNGVIFWESAWVSTPCRTPWGQGSSHDHVAFFEPTDFNFIKNGGGDWPNPIHYKNY